MSLIFAINGDKFELQLSSIDPSTTLLEFLRSNTRFKSVKLSCGEGGCGACVVLLSKYDPLLDKVEDFTISSCLTLLGSIHGCSITTSEGLGNSKTGFHPVHERISGFHASQCGFCTPGMCVSLYSALVNSEKSKPKLPEPSPGFSKLTVSEAEKAVAGNLCRCTGYRPIVDACKSFACDVDVEDLGFNAFRRNGENKEEMLRNLPVYDRNNHVSTFPDFLKKEIQNRTALDSRKYRWSNPVTVAELQSILEDAKKAGNRMPVKLVAGNTSIGYYKEEREQKYEKYIDVSRIPELTVVRRREKGIEIGAAVTISKVIEALRDEKYLHGSSSFANMFEKIASHMGKIASGFVRNTGSIGGNLVMAQRKQFPSDVATVLLAVGATLNIMTFEGQESVALDEFLERPPLDPDSVLLRVEIPFWNIGAKNDSSSETETELLFETYRASQRPLGNALAYLNAAFLAELSPCKELNGITVNNCRLAFGAYGTKHAIRVRKVEEFLNGKSLDHNVLYEAVELLKSHVVPSDGTSNPAYRSSLAVSFLFDFFSPLTEGCLDEYKSFLLHKEPGANQNNGRLDQRKSTAMLSSSQQVFAHTDYHPVGKPIIKSGASLQASGEAVYVDDIPSPANCLYGAFVYSTKPLARIKGISFRQYPAPDGVLAIITFKDVPECGQNLGICSVFGTEPLFADELSRCAGQRIALVVADSQRNADMAANQAVIAYDTENLEPPILSVEDAVEKSSIFEIPPFLQPKPVGDVSKGMSEADHKILRSEIRLGSQYFFYMETQTALAVPDEDNCMAVYSSTQNAEFVHSTIAKCLGVPEHNVRVITRRVGGGFGGKALKSIPVATACALAASKLQRPVRMYLNRKTDMIMAGGRHPMKLTYSVGFKSTGKVTALDVELLINAGIAGDVRIMMPYTVLGALKKYDWGAFSFDYKVCKTNLPSRTAMRSPGELQGSYFAEAIIENIASSLSMDVDAVRKINLHTYESLSAFHEDSAGERLEYTLPLIWDKLGKSSSFDQRVETIKAFNGLNRWRKRGISRVPIVHEVIQRATPGRVSILSDGSVVVEVGGVEIGQGLWTKVKQMAAFALGLVQCDGTNDELLEKIRVVQADTLSMVQGGFTANSTTSEGSCEAVRICCGTLVDRLRPVRNALAEKTGGHVSWDMLILQAYMQSVNLSASTLFTPEFTSAKYLNYGAAASEVEVNLLTGQTKILRTDIVYDCGKSLNPAVDLGQIEGAFVQGVGFFILEEYLANSDGLMVADSTWTYKIPTVDTIPRQFNVEILNSGHHEKRVLSSKASGEPPLLLAASVHCATRAAIKEARKQLLTWRGEDGSDLATFQLPVPATMPVVKELCGLDTVEKYLQWKIGTSENKTNEILR